MNNLLSTVCLALFVVCIPTLHGASDEPVAAAVSLDDVSWLAGRWRGEHEGTIWEEHWMEPAGGCMTGMFRMHNGEKTIVQELVIFEQHEDEVRFYLRHFGARGEIWEAEQDGPLTFRVVHAERDEIAMQIISDDPDQGPAWIVYRFKGEGTAEAWIGSDRAGEGDGFALPIERF